MVDDAYEPESYGDASVSAPNTLTSSTEQSMCSATICARIVSQPVPMSAAPMSSMNVPSSLSFTVTDPTSTPEMPEPCMDMAMPAARTLPPPMSRTGNFASQSNSSRQRARQRSSAHAFVTSP